MQKGAKGLASAHPAGIWVVWRTYRNREHTRAGHGDFVIGGSCGGLGCGGCASDNQERDESTDHNLHKWPQKVRFVS